MLLNESLHQYVPTFKRLKQGNTAYGKAPLLFFCEKMVEILRGCLCINQIAQYKLVGVYLPFVWTRNILGVGFGKPHLHVGFEFGKTKANGKDFVEYMVE
jgi:hypothetical protein